MERFHKDFKASFPTSIASQMMHKERVIPQKCATMHEFID